MFTCQKNGYNVNLIRNNQKGDFITLQSIHFGTNNLFGQMSKDGEYLIPWDDKSNKLKLENMITIEQESIIIPIIIILLIFFIINSYFYLHFCITF
ncbi:unnamed protein product [Paramecium primaurelia]|uniref:Uncharacterized protein n=1 Tax=Paramecium primaurelia TaxID=5886 RepID=A0A8S1M2X9_PARPR|nr:unnamed protein product [Paramecium primaurelia]